VVGVFDHFDLFDETHIVEWWRQNVRKKSRKVVQGIRLVSLEFDLEVQAVEIQIVM